MKIQLLYAMARIGTAGELVISAPGEILEIDEHEGSTLIEQGQAVAILEPEAPKKTKKVL